MNQPTLRVVLFDLDGTLIDTESQYTVFWREIAQRYRSDVYQLEEIIKGTTLRQTFDMFFPDPEHQAQITEALNVCERQMDYSFFPGALEFISDLRNHGVHCAIVTSSNQMKMNAVRAQIPNFDSLFDRVLTAELFRASKPDPDCYLLGARVFDANLSECVVFEDAYTGLQAGMSSGIYTIGMASGHTPDEIRDRCHHVITGYENLSYQRLLEIRIADR